MEKIQAGVSKNDYFGMGLCDNGVLFGVPSFVKASETISRPYVIGIEIHLNDDVLCVYAINEEGYHHLIELSTLIQKEELTFDLFKERTAGLVGVIETSNGKFQQLFVEQDASFSRYLFDYSDLFKDGFYLGIEVTKKEDVAYANSIRKFAIRRKKMLSF